MLVSLRWQNDGINDSMINGTHWLYREITGTQNPHCMTNMLLLFNLTCLPIKDCRCISKSKRIYLWQNECKQMSSITHHKTWYIKVNMTHFSRYIPNFWLACYSTHAILDDFIYISEDNSCAYHNLNKTHSHKTGHIDNTECYM